MNKLKQLVCETGRLFTLQETIPSWITDNNVFIDFDQCMIVRNTDKGYTVVSNELQCSLAHAKTFEECILYLFNKVSFKVRNNFAYMNPFLDKFL